MFRTKGGEGCESTLEPKANNDQIAQSVTILCSGVMLCRTKTGQGWGITTDGESLIVSDGSQYLFFWDPITMKETRRVEVKTRERGGKIRFQRNIFTFHQHFRKLIREDPRTPCIFAVQYGKIPCLLLY